jgi:predicted dehydrogenase
MAARITRRQMIRSSALAGAGVWMAAGTAGARSASPNEKLNVACVGIGGRGESNVNGVAGENLVALCDCDDKRAAAAHKKFPNVKKYKDFRKMFDEMEKQIDAVVVSTPDHTHFHPAMRALKSGKHLYCEKPMAHNLWEVRQLTKTAREKKLATQLSTQRHAQEGMGRIVEVVKAGTIGEIREVHAWIAGDRGMPEVPTEGEPVPAHLDWDLWLGPAAERPYNRLYCPYLWRFYWDFGTGETGNFGCHVLDVPYWALDLKFPTKVQGSGPPVHPKTTPKQMATRFEFPARGSQPPVTLHWYHAKNGPPILKEKGLPHEGNVCLFLGSKGMLLTSYDKYKLYPEADFAGFQPPPKTIPKSPGFYREWIDACKGGKPATCNFEYGGPLTETVLLGNLAYRSGEAFEWDAENLKPRGKTKAESMIREEYRKGWPAEG